MRDVTNKNDMCKYAMDLWLAQESVDYPWVDKVEFDLIQYGTLRMVSVCGEVHSYYAWNLDGLVSACCPAACLAEGMRVCAHHLLRTKEVE